MPLGIFHLPLARGLSPYGYISKTDRFYFYLSVLLIYCTRCCTRIARPARAIHPTGRIFTNWMQFSAGSKLRTSSSRMAAQSGHINTFLIPKGSSLKRYDERCSSGAIHIRTSLRLSLDQRLLLWCHVSWVFREVGAARLLDRSIL